MLVRKDLEPGQEERDRAAEKNAERTEAAEEMQRPGHIFQQEPDGQEIKKDAKCAGDAVVALAALAVHIADRNFADAGAVP